MGMGCFKKEGRWVGSTRPNRSKEVIKGSAHVSVLGLPSSTVGENKEELPTPRCTRDFSMQEASALGQDRNAPPWKSYTSGMYPISTILGGVSGESSGPSSSSPYLPGMGNSMGISQSRQLEETIEDPLETELPLCMVLKDGCSFSLPGDASSGSLMRKKRGTLSGSRKERELKKLVSTINYDGVAGKETKEGELGRQMTVGEEGVVEELVVIKGLWNDPWCIVGDFNVVRFPAETSNGRQMSTAMREFSSFIEERLGGTSDRAMQCLLTRPVSDHCLILLDCGGVRKGESKLCDSEKLQALKHDLKLWNKESLDDVSEDRRSQGAARDEFNHCAILEEISWRQKSRALWLKEGDSNTKFFHRMANARRRENFISSLTVMGIRLSKEEELKEWIGSYFKSMFEDPIVRRPEVESGLFNTLDSLDNDILEMQFSIEEVLRALSDLGGDKAPGPNGFTLAFWKTCWPVVRGEVMQDYRSISLVRSLYKIIAKVLANRLKGVMGKLVSNSQNAFVEGRQILDAVLVANEAIDLRKRSVGTDLV
ncbi:hypothetical protein CK203_091289 [Vitis vinifera]|uniref:Uncharacterized protein n=1 Tax=Vitis vinifera TaxID=29760 RepID=A0A438DRM3_VITVI|nr:hypothetical protein CK203_091289 [Vitis vinifera]